MYEVANPFLVSIIRSFPNDEVRFCTQGEGELVAHSEELSEANVLVLWPDVELLHLLDGEPDGVLVVAGHHDSDAL